MIIYILIATALIIALGLFKILSKKPQAVQQKIEQPKKKIDVEQLIPISIYYGSQQGTAARFAKQLAEEGRDFGFITNEVDLNEVNFKEEMIQGKVGLFCMATHGEGDPTDNAKKFIAWLEEDQPSLIGFRFGVFGLGNRQYEHYNKIGKLTNQLLEKQQGIRCFNYGEGDANSTLEDDFIEWKATIWPVLKVALSDLIQQSKNQNVQQSIEQVEESVTSQHGQVFSLTVSDQPQINFEEAQGQFDFQTKQLLKAKECEIVSIEELRQNTNDGSTLHIVFDTGKVGIQYQTAMNLGVFPENDPQQVQELAEYLGEKIETIYKLELIQQQNKSKLPFPSPISVENILKRFLDFNGQLMKNTLTKLVKLVNDEQVKNHLQHLTSAEGKQDFTQLVDTNKTTIVQLLKQFNIKINLAQFIELCPRISPRLFTIASSNLKSPNQVQIADSLLIDELPNGTKKLGLCSQYFMNIRNQIIQGQKPTVRVDFRESSFKLPESPDQSLIMIGPGTGLAPFIAFLQEREVFLQNQQQKQNKYILYFGCKHQNGDFIYRDQINYYKNNNILDELHLAFSRDQQNKVYVQDLLKQHKEQLYQMMSQNKAVIYICGSTQMGNSVQQLFRDILIELGHLSLEEAEKSIQNMEKSKQLIKELW